MSPHLYSEKLFVRFMKSWEAEYRKQTAADNYVLLSAVSGRPVSTPLKPAEKKVLSRLLDGQILFMKYYATTRMLITHTEENFIGVKKFLARQNFWDIKGGVPEYVVQFTLMNESMVFLLTNDLDEFDYADIYGGTAFEWINVDKLSWKAVPAKFPVKFEKLLRKDLEYDYDGVDLEYPYEYDLGTGQRPFQIKVEIMGDLGFDKVVKANKCNDLFKVDILKWVLGK